jgi:hypothetical protein
MKKTYVITGKTIAKYYAVWFVIGAIVAVVEEIAKDKTRTHTEYKPSPEFQNLVNHYNNKQKEKVS